MKTTETAGGSAVQSIDRTFHIIEVLAEKPDGLGLTELGKRVGLHKSTVHRLLLALIHHGYVEQDSGSSVYRLSLKMYEIGSKIIDDLALNEVARPLLSALKESVNEVVHLVIRDDIEIMYIDKVEADNKIRMHSRIGARSPLYCTSAGKAMMAFLPEQEIVSIWERSHIQKLTIYTITDLEKMREELNQVKNRGYAIDNEENELGIRCVGAPIFNYRDEVIGAISISGPTLRVTPERVAAFGEAVMATGRLISQKIGHRVK
ncbi:MULTISPECIES: IclR family transcriptional regulator [Anoxynatronum]|uniref:Glycerol operon regulatory protein n=2 Tax=Anoxynatronum TaxID=210622 RepID=A0AA46AHK6_9CLOT|nr:IclR family transcriptional regulator [Anoxynatronum buryatiense]SMP39902.1 transcriptional regulator, IclR family [Anoxynatronum buryatiense]